MSTTSTTAAQVIAFWRDAGYQRWFVRDAGFNRWADAYDVAVLYPQTRASFNPLNPQACFD